MGPDDKTLGTEEAQLTTNAELDVKTPDVKEEPKKTPAEQLADAIKEYPFLKFENGILMVKHSELSQFLKPVCLRIGDIVKRGTIISKLNGGVQNVDQQTADFNGAIATVMVGFEEPLKVDVMKVEDTDLILGLYVSVVAYNAFFRKTPLGFAL